VKIVTEKVIHEIRFIEEEDGFRIEIKGDKERIKKMGARAFGKKMFGPGRFFRRSRRRGSFRGHGHCGDMPPWDWEWEEPTDEPEASVEGD
jgi:hypothetical protein